MASQAQIDANRRNAAKSTGPKTDAGKARARFNALKDGSRARIANRVLPQENAAELGERINRWINDLKPRNDAEGELVIHAANLAWELDRGRRSETSRLAKRVRKAQLKDTAQRMKQVEELGRRLLFNTGPRILDTSGPRWEDTPAAFLRGLEQSAEGCRWLLDRWAGLRTLLDYDSEWTYGDMFCLVRLLGKYPVDAIIDPKLNAVFLAFDAVVPGWAERFWKECKRCKPLHDPGFSDFGRCREIAKKPADAVKGVQFFYDLIDERMARLEELLELHEEIAGDEADELADRVSSDDSVRGERRRRQQTAKGRELRQTIELLLKMQKANNDGQAAGNGGKLKEGDHAVPAPKTTALAVAAPREEQCEPGSASKPAPKKRSQDRQHLAPALEMVMSERLAEQVFENLFDDPPAELASLKGSPELAELKVLPGRAPVRATAIRESTPSEKVAEKVKNEANDSETQTDEIQAVGMLESDSAGDNRSQVRGENSVGH
jgi:hypothetical protein